MSEELIIGLVSISDRDFTDTFGEAGALAKYLGEEHEKSGSELIRELASTHRTPTPAWMGPAIGR